MTTTADRYPWWEVAPDDAYCPDCEKNSKIIADLKQQLEQVKPYLMHDGLCNVNFRNPASKDCDCGLQAILEKS
jgi:hypothetical protein